MRSSTVSAFALLALGASAMPTPDTTADTHYTLNIKNNCKETKNFGTYQIQTPSFTMNKLSEVVPIASGKSGQIKVPFNALGVRLSAQADKENQWEAQQLVEFGYAAWTGLTGVAYDLSSIGVTNTVPMSVCPADKSLTQCPCKQMKGNNLAESLSQVWTAASQSLQGSPADTTCMFGKQDFDIEWC